MKCRIGEARIDATDLDKQGPPRFKLIFLPSNFTYTKLASPGQSVHLVLKYINGLWLRKASPFSLVTAVVPPLSVPEEIPIDNVRPRFGLAAKVGVLLAEDCTEPKSTGGGAPIDPCADARHGLQKSHSCGSNDSP
jgi:hypothetical protein